MKGVASIFAAVVIAAASTAAIAAPPIEVFGQMPQLDMVVLSPSGKRVAFIVNDKGKRAMAVREVDGAFLSATPLADDKIRSIKWAGENIVLVTSSSTHNWGLEFNLGDDFEFFQTVSIDLAGKKSFPVFAKATALPPTFGTLGTRLINGRWYGFFVGYEGNPDRNSSYAWLDGFADVFKVDLVSGEASVVARGRQGVRDWQLGPEDKIVARSEYLYGSGQTKIFSEGRVAPALTRADEFGRVNLIGLGRSDGTVLIAEPGETDDTIEELALNGSGQVQKVESFPKWSELFFDESTHRFIGMLGEAGTRQVKMLDPKVQARVAGALAAFPNSDVRIVSRSDDFGRMVVLTQGKGDPGTYWLVDISTGKAQDLGMRYGLKPEEVGPIRLIDYKAADGLAMQGVLTLPPGKPAKNLPLVVLPHGGPESHDTTDFDWWAQAFASRGYAVFQPNFRGSTGYGLTFQNAGHGEWGRKMQTDISDGVAALAAQGVIDPKRACIVGGSYGGYAALAGVTVQHGLYRCAVSYGGIADMKLMFEDRPINSPGGRHIRTFTGVSGPGDAKVAEISPMALKEQADAPILLIHGKSDTVVPIKQSQNFEREMKKIGKPIELITLDGEDHWLSRPETRVAMLKASVAFVEKNNPAN